MKAKMPQKLVLSIGMIVKNEAEVLARCLESLQPLMEAVPSELIIADTGSEDGTVEIAQRYTDQVYRFQWENDFSAARNSTMERARGQWYMYLDADEWFENMDEIIHFFRGREKEQFETAAYAIRSYVTPDIHGEYTETFSLRMIQNRADRRFTSPIHEYLPALSPCKFFHGSYAHHLGYAMAPGEVSKKPERNIPILLKKLESGQDLAHTYCQLGREHMVLKNEDKAIAYLLKAKEVLQPKEFTLRCMMYHDLAQCYYLAGKYQDTVDTAVEYFSISDQEFSSGIDISALAVMAYRELQQHTDVVEMFRRYQRLWKLMEAGKLNEVDRLSVIVQYYKQEAKSILATECAKSFYMLDRADEALEIIEECFAEDPRGIRMPLLYQLEQNYIRVKGDFDRCRRRYNELKALDVKVPIRLLQENIIQMIHEEPKTLPGVVEALTKCDGAEDDWFIGLLRLRCADVRGEKEEALLQKLQQVAPVQEEGPGVLYYALKWAQDFSVLARRADLDNLTEYFERMKKYGDLGAAIKAYFSVEREPGSLLVEKWEISLMERYLMTDGRAEDVADLELFERYCRKSGAFTRALYAPEVLAGDRLAVPRAQRFGLQACEALEKRSQGDTLSFIRDLGKAGEVYPLVAPYIERILKRVQEEQKRQQEIENEKAMLFLQIREKIRALINGGDLANAAQILDQYAKLNPNDEAISYFRQKLNNPVEPS